MLRALALLTVLSLAACAVDPCQRSAQVNLPGKVAGCPGLDAGLNFGAPGNCSFLTSMCSRSDQAALVKAVDCLDRLSACTDATQGTFISGRDACLAPLSSTLHDGCKEVFTGPQPLPDAGVSYTLTPLDDGDAGVELFGVADEGRVALAWTAQRASPFRWTIGANDGGPWFEASGLAPTGPLRWDGPLDASEFFVAALDDQDAVLLGEPFLPARTFDGGTACRVPLDCAPALVCDLGFCVAQSCQPGGALTCPPGFVCYPDAQCHRQSSVGAFDAGTFDAGMLSPRLLLSNRVQLSSAAPVFQPDVALGRFNAHHTAVAALDTAHLFCAAEQEGLLLGHASSRRGLDLAADEATAVLIDTIGSDVHLAFNADSQSLYACYTVGRSVRLQRSIDDGRSWGTQVLTFEPPADAGMTSRLSDCELAAWKDGGVLLVTVEDDALAVREVLPTLASSLPTIAFRSTGPDGGQPYTPRHPAVATARASDLVHVTFTASRVIGPVDLEPYVVTSRSTTLSFSAPQSLAMLGTGVGSALPQDWTRVAIEPQTGRSVAVFSTLEPGPQGSAAVADLYPVLYDPALNTWATRTDLGVFTVDPRDGNTTLLMPAKQKNDRWNAFSPQLAVLPDGRIFFSFVAGPLTLQGGDFRLYATRFDFDGLSPLGTSHGRFLAPAAPVSQTRVFDPRPLLGDVPPRISSLAADAQLSLFSAFSEGAGTQGEVEGRALTNVRP